MTEDKQAQKGPFSTEPSNCQKIADEQHADPTEIKEDTPPMVGRGAKRFPIGRRQLKCLLSFETISVFKLQLRIPTISVNIVFGELFKKLFSAVLW